MSRQAAGCGLSAGFRLTGPDLVPDLESNQIRCGTGRSRPARKDTTLFHLLFACIAIAVVSVAAPAHASVLATMSVTTTGGNADLVYFRCGNSLAGINDTFSCAWDFGDGQNTANAVAPSHRYARPGTYTATVTVCDPTGACDTNSQTFVLADQTPAAGTIQCTMNPGGKYVGYEAGQPVPFQVADPQCNYDSDPDFDWDFGDGTSVDSGESRSATHAYASAGTYRVKVRFRLYGTLRTTVYTAESSFTVVILPASNPRNYPTDPVVVGLGAIWSHVDPRRCEDLGSDWWPFAWDAQAELLYCERLSSTVAETGVVAVTGIWGGRGGTPAACSSLGPEWSIFAYDGHSNMNFCMKMGPTAGGYIRQMSMVWKGFCGGNLATVIWNGKSEIAFCAEFMQAQASCDDTCYSCGTYSGCGNYCGDCPPACDNNCPFCGEYNGCGNYCGDCVPTDCDPTCYSCGAYSECGNYCGDCESCSLSWAGCW
jgi:PKD repeat protein